MISNLLINTVATELENISIRVLQIYRPSGALRLRTSAPLR
jgi:hypothetical protein